MKKNRLSLAALGVLAIALTGSSLQAQDAATKPAARPMAVETEAAEELRVRLPNYFGKLVDAAQRERIYDVQRKRLPEIKQLEARIEVLRKQLEAEMEAILSPSQRAELQRMRDEASAKSRQSAENSSQS